MTATSARAYRPALRPGVLLSPPLLRGPRTVHLVKHPNTGAAFEVGIKEHFLISLLDGTRNLDDVAPAYADRFGRRLGEEQWNRFLGLLGARGLLSGAPGPAAPSPSPKPPNTFWRGNRPLVADADATTARLHRALRPLLRPAVQLPCSPPSPSSWERWCGGRAHSSPTPPSWYGSPSRSWASPCSSG